MDSSSTLNSAATNALTLSWAFGFNKDVADSVHSLCANGRQALFYVAAHTGVIYDYTTRTQELLQVCVHHAQLHQYALLARGMGCCARFRGKIVTLRRCRSIVVFMFIFGTTCKLLIFHNGQFLHVARLNVTGRGTAIPFAPWLSAKTRSGS